MVGNGKGHLARGTQRIPLLQPLFLLLLFTFVGGNAAARPGVEAQSVQIASGVPSGSFAIDDFDGDRRPDFANIESGESKTGISNYWIQLQLSVNGRRSIHLEAPSGGLVIEARDVNADDFIDLVLVTAWQHRPVAIFLNDGHGNFSSARPAAFPSAFHQSDSGLGTTSRQQTKSIGAPPQSRDGIGPGAKQLSVGRKDASSFLGSTSQVFVSPVSLSHAGRAPPFAVPQS
jgi:hypothetical protein